MTESSSAPDANPSGQTSSPLIDGDCLNAKEFLRRYLPNRRQFKAELINGIVSLNRGNRSHAKDLSSSVLRSWFNTYALLTPGTRIESDIAVVLGWNNVPQPNIVLRVLPEHGGKSRLGDDQTLVDAPELAADFTTNRQAFELREKIRAFRQNGVAEYLVWRTDDKTLDWYFLERGEYALNLPDSNGVVSSHHFPGLRLNLSALMNRNSGAVMATLRKSLERPEHAAFVGKLEKRGKQTRGS